MTAIAATRALPAPTDPLAGRLPPTPAIIDRPRLVTRLAAAGEGCVVSLRAPAGYGKTTLLSQWAAADPRAFAWLNLDARDDDPARLLARVGGVLARGGPGERFVLVLDDAHVLRTQATRAHLALIAADLPAGSTLALAVRAECPLPLARLRSQRRLVELGPGALAMTRDEAAAVLALAGRRLAPRQLDALMHATEGWPAALSLALLALAEGRAPARLTGDEPLFAEYLGDEVLAELDADQRAFLRRASVLDVLSGPACDEVLARSGSAAMLARLARADVLLVPLDPRSERYRCHHLLRDALAAELRRVEPGVAARLHRRAAGWHRRANDVDGAVGHALAGGDPGRAAAVVWATTPGALCHGDAAAVEERLARFTPHQITTTPVLALAAAGAELAGGRGDVAEHWLSVAAGAARDDAPATIAAGLAATAAALSRAGLHRAIADAERALALAPADGPAGALCHLVAGTAHRLLGDPRRAAPELEAGARRAAVTAPLLHALCLTQLGVLALDRDDRDEAEELLARARAQVDRHGLADVPACALVFAAGALVRAREGRTDDARGDLAQATRLQAWLVDFPPWYGAELRILAARAAWRLCDVPGARIHLRRAARLAERLPEATALADWIAETEAQVAASTAADIPTPDPLTAAELRILGYLPTHLSFREIAERTFVSANTVKTQANAVYRKLGVSSRSEAVARARALAVLDPP